MPINNNRNSRDDKSKRPSRSSASDSSSKPFRRKPDGADSSNGEGKKLFGSEHKRPFKSGFKKADDKPARTGERFAKPSSRAGEGTPERKPFGKSAENKFGKSERPYRRKEEGQANDNKFGKDKPGFSSERPSRYGKADTGKPYKKDFGDKRSYAGDRKRTSESKPATPRAKKTSEDDGLIRLNRYISNAGICSRRKADELIEAGVITVNGEVVNELGAKVNPMKDVVRYNGETLKREKMVYVLLNKPKDYITTTDDPHERRTVMQLVEKASRERIYPVGRLDRNTTGLLLMTNDGDLTDKLSHPKNNVTKIYNVELNRSLSQGDMNKIAYGLELEDGLIKPDEVSYVQGGSKREVGIQIHSGKNRIVRRIFEHLGYEVVKLDRVVYANLTKKDLPRGRWRYLEEKEIIQLKHLIKS
ncbi:MAG: pseudouridine synthase [Sphingobacteriaceae bacterium]|jgi:23S rRNA pseudouridine2605 synthase|nr:pseudouridine synthase [Sphingobacteriaceae bacterium]